MDEGDPSPDTLPSEDATEESAKAKETKGSKALQKYLIEVRDRAAPDAEARTFVRKKAQEIQKKLLFRMLKLDKLFEEIYEKKKDEIPDISGSVRLRAKVGPPNEFDVNIPLILPIEDVTCITITPAESKEYASWYSISFPKTAWKWPVVCNKRRKVWKHLFKYDEDTGMCTMSAAGLRGWTQGLVYRALRKWQEDETEKLKELNITESRSGPAITLSFTASKKNEENESVIRASIDIVAVLKMDPATRQRPDICAALGEPETEMLLVPVAPRVRKGSDAPPDSLFRADFPQLLDRLGKRNICLPDAVRLLKVMKEEHKWKAIASYFIYELAYTYERGRGEGQIKSEKQLPDVFMKLVDLLQQAIRQGHLSMLLFPDYNLLVKLDDKFRTNVANFLKDSLRRMEFAKAGENAEHMLEVVRRVFEPSPRPKVLRPRKLAS